MITNNTIAMKYSPNRKFPITSGLSILFACLVSWGAEPVIGWRGDGSGKYPTADPPISWSRISIATKGLRYSTAKSDRPDAGAPVPDGVIREWLIAGPVPFDQDNVPPDAIPQEAAVDPEAGDMLGKARWQKVVLDTAYLDFMHLLGKPQDQDVAAYALARVYSPTIDKFRIDLTCAAKAQIWVNGKKPITTGARATIALDKGWNRLLIRTVPAEKDWYAVAVMHGVGACQYEQSGIVWRTVLPAALPGFYGGGMGVGSPVIVGNHLYLPSDPHDLLCLNKSDGKVLWLQRVIPCRPRHDRSTRGKVETRDGAAQTDEAR
jgi:hypothetical protein